MPVDKAKKELNDMVAEKMADPKIKNISIKEQNEEIKELMDQIQTSSKPYMIDEFSARKYVMRRLSRSTNKTELMGHLRNYYGMSASNAQILIQKCRAELSSQIKQLTKTVAARNVKLLYDIADECMDKQLYDTAINAIKELNKMSGVTQYNSGPQVTIAKNKQGEELINITFDQ